MMLKQRMFAARHIGRCFTILLLLAGGRPSYAEKPPVPTMRVPLRSLGFPGHPLALMHAGRSMATLHLLDSSHILFTYSLRSLVPRIPGDDENDSDRLVAAEVVEVPSGKILARTEWHLHDYGRYLWSVGDGVFVMRVRDELSTFSPLRGLPFGTSFQRVALPHRPGLPELVTSSPDGAVVTVQIALPGHKSEEDNDEETKAKRHYAIEFYRVTTPTEREEPVLFKRAGVIGSPRLLRLALDGDGYLWAEDKERNRWALSFNEYEGKPQNMAAIDSSCNPRLELLSRSQFVAFTCRGSDDSYLLSAYGFDGHETWQESFGQALQEPLFVAAPSAGRFALSRLTANPQDSSPGTSGAVAANAETTRQEIRVYQTESGQLLMNLHPAPAMRSGQNFDLSQDGRTLAVLGSDAIDFYTLPEITAQDRKDLAEVATMRPPESHGPIVLRRITRPIAEEAAETAAAATNPDSALPLPPGTSPAADPAPTAAKPPSSAAGRSTGTPSAAAPTQAAVTEPAAQGDAQGAARKPPTLLAPGEVPEFKPKSTPKTDLPQQ